MINNLSIAVLPFKNMSSNKESEYFCDGLTEEIINALAKINGLKVTSRTSSFFFKNKDISITEIGKDLNVSSVLEGSVRLSQDKIRITAQLIEAQNDFHFWSETWDRKLENIFDVQDEISLIIADKIRENFGHFELQDKLVEEQTESIEAYKNYLKGHSHFIKWNPKDAHIAIQYFEKAIMLDEFHAESYCGLAQTYSFLASGGFLNAKIAIPKAKSYADKALSLNNKIPEVYFSLASVEFWNEWNLDKTLSYIKKVFQINPNYVPAYILSSMVYVLLDKKSLAIKYINDGLSLDPFSVNLLFIKSWIYYLSKEYKQALKLANLVIEQDSNFLPAYLIKGSCLLKTKKYDEVLNYFLDKKNEHIDYTSKIGMQGIGYAFKRNVKKAKDALIDLENEFNNCSNHRALNFIFLIYSVLGDNNMVIKWLNKSIEIQFSYLLFLISDPIVEPLSNDLRFIKIKQQFFNSKMTLNLLSEEKSQLLDEDSIKTYSKRLFNYIDDKQPYLDTSLTLRKLATDLTMHPNQLSWLINHEFNKNFNEFINHYRIETFKRISKDPKNSHITLIGLAYDSGFNSKTVFNTSFKKETGLTPMQYLKLNN